jgi:hypothetical protein
MVATRLDAPRRAKALRPCDRHAREAAAQRRSKAQQGDSGFRKGEQKKCAKTCGRPPPTYTKTKADPHPKRKSS